MKFIESPLTGVWTIEAETFRDERGSFSQVFLTEEFRQHKLETEFGQWSLSDNEIRGTLRGMHFQKPPFAQGKLIQCVRGSIFDVAIDLREGSPTFRKWWGTEISAKNNRMLHIAPGFAHGFITLEDHTCVYYHLSKTYTPDSQSGIRWDDPKIGIHWPLNPTRVSDRDRAYPLLK
ncbi:MAG: dTDP-4-dehydrorhamnose 3,5-epimerase [Bacteriovoracia bacterium]